MTTVTGDLLSATLTGAKSIFNDALPAAVNAASYLKFVLDGRAIPTAGKSSMQYGWLTEPPKMTRFTGTLAIDDLVGYDFTLTNYLYVASFGVDRLAYERDALGQIPPRTRQLADECVRYRGEKLFDLITGGGSASVESPTYDAAGFFGSTRTIGDSGTIDNTLATAGASATHFTSDLAAARAAMMAFKDARGRPINRAPNVILIHPAHSAYAFEALVGNTTDSPVVPAGNDGLAMWEARGYTVIESAYLTDTAGMYFMHVSPGAAPFILQEEFTPQLEGITRPDSESGVVYERYVYKARDCFAVGYGDPRLCIYTT